MIKAAIFDMDGVLLDSEPLWHEAEIEVFATVGIKLTRAQCIETTGLMVRDITAYHYSREPWSGKIQKQVTEEIFDSVEKKILEKAVPLEGVNETIEFLRIRNVPIALASSTGLKIINTVLEKLSLKGKFKIVHTAEHEKYSKPHPAVFLSTAKQLDVDPVQCLVIEDSFNGLIAAKAARMKTIALPMASQWNETRFDIADLKLHSLAEFNEGRWNYLNSLP
jgi:mannitol-1-/sugar-/sorbitol-6-/2-deoxyglucose-6-phosphatase